MNAPRCIRIAALAAALGLAASVAFATCTIVPLTAGTPVTTSTAPAIYQFTQGASYWTAVGVRPVSGEDWDLFLDSATAPDPGCVTNTLASSTYSTSVVDFVVGDFNHDPLGTYYAYLNRYSGSQPATVEWDSGANVVVPDGSAVSGLQLATDVVKIWDVNLTAGTTYTFDFFPQGGSGAHLMLFRNSGGGVYWAGRSAAVLDLTASGSFTPPASGYYGLVLVNDGARRFRYSLGVTSGACGIPYSLSDETPVTIPPSGQPLAFDVEIQYWTGVAVRPASGDWDLAQYSAPSGGTSPTCLAGLLSTSSLGGSVVDLALGDYNHTPLGWKFALPSVFTGSANASIEALGSAGVLEVNDDPVSGSLPATELAECRDVYLYAGHTYAVNYSATTGLNLLLFTNAAGGSYWCGRSAAVMFTSASTTFTAATSGWYGLVIVNDGAVSGSYTLAFGDCGLVTPLASGVAATTGSERNAYFAFTPKNYWCAFGIRSTAVDWDVTLGADSVSTPWPECSTTTLATSTNSPPKQDVLVGMNAVESPHYVYAHQYTAGTASPAVVQMQDGGAFPYPNDTPLTGTTGPNQVVTFWGLELYAGDSYQFDLAHTGSASFSMLLFRYPGSGEYWAGRGSAVLDVSTATATFSPPSDGVYVLVLVNENGATDNYTLNYSDCYPPMSLATLPGSYGGTWVGMALWSFTQSNRFWTPVAVYSEPPEDWDVYVYSQPTGGPMGTCLNNLLGYSSQGAGVTDFVVGDFNYNALGTYYAREVRYSGTADDVFGWYSGSQVLGLGAAPVTESHSLFGAIVRSWDASLAAGQTYTLQFSHPPTLDAKVDVFAPTGTAQWATRSNAIVEGQHTITFTAPVAGWYGIVVVIDGGTGSYDLALRAGTADVTDDTPRPERDAFGGLSPNPGRGSLRLAFALRDGGTPSFEVLDMAGRRVATVASGARGSGEWALAWRAADDAGRPLAPGLYFLRMRLGARIVGTRKVTLLE